MRALFIIVFAISLAGSLAGCGGAATQCSVTGKWMASPVMGTIASEKVAQVFNADGSYEVDIDDAAWYGRWSQSGDRLTISDDGSCPAGTGDGVYHLRWDPDCKGAIYELVSDPCLGRSTTLNGMRIIMPF